MSLAALLENLPLLGLVLAAALIDARWRRIPNWLSLGLVAAGLARGALAGGLMGLWPGAAGVLAGAGPPMILYCLGAVGGGDVKLLAGIGAWLGPAEAVEVFAAQCVIGLVIVLAQAVSQGRTRVMLRNSALVALSPGAMDPSASSIEKRLPMALPIAAATWAVVILGPLI